MTQQRTEAASVEEAKWDSARRVRENQEAAAVPLRSPVLIYSPDACPHQAENAAKAQLLESKQGQAAARIGTLEVAQQ